MDAVGDALPALDFAVEVGDFLHDLLRGFGIRPEIRIARLLLKLIDALNLTRDVEAQHERIDLVFQLF